ncbi:hypothetical protein BGP_0222 [Beggiatoa sp. PS]|nr:hypothetical protein BGP_0222 [Beggiatoa sp. PS]
MHPPKFTRQKKVDTSVNSVLSVGVQSEALHGQTKLRFELQRTRQNRLDSVLAYPPLFTIHLFIFSPSKIANR